MATIEPRLIHLLNDSTTPQLPHADLPPFHSLPLPEYIDRPLPPLERDPAHRGDRIPADGAARPLATHPAGEDEPSVHHRIDDVLPDGNHTGGADIYPMRMLLRETDASEPLYPLPKILDDSPDGSCDDAARRKRNRALSTREDYLQLPQPLKKQKPAVPMHTSVMPPIINGLHEPPPHAALFPPIASTTFRESDHGPLNPLVESIHTSDDQSSRQKTPSETDKSSTKGRKRATKPRRKWSEEETNHLLLGVSKHGVGKWTTILEDREFKFNGRSAGDLKDRFRTCCPAELRGSKSDGRQSTTPPRSHQQRPRKGLHSENILHEDDDAGNAGMLTPPTEPDVPPPKQKKTRAHRKKLEDLESLGIHAPFKKSLRRERRPFTEQDDQEILKGLDKYGPAWTKIQRDPNFRLSSRQPTDLRDRVRNKYPKIYQRIEKGTYQAKDAAVRSNDTLEPSVTMSIANSLKPPNQMNRSGSKEELAVRGPPPISELLDRNPSSQSLDLGGSSPPQWLGGEMGISRLLLDDSR